MVEGGGHHSELLWASASYAEVFKISRAEQGASKASQAPQLESEESKRFLSLLGAEVSPRLVEVATDSAHIVLASQTPARRFLGRARGGLRRDFVSPDLDAVIRNIRQNPTQSVSRGTKHDVQIYFDATPQWATKYGQSEGGFRKDRKNAITYLKTGTAEQAVLGKRVMMFASTGVTFIWLQVMIDKLL